MKETQLRVRNDGFGEIAETVLLAVSDIIEGLGRVAGESVIHAVKTAYLKGYGDGFRDAIRQVQEPMTNDEMTE